MVDDRRLWTNSPVLMQRVLQEKDRKAWTTAKGNQSCRELSWGRLFSDALKEQIERKEEDYTHHVGFSDRRMMVWYSG